MNQRGQAAAQHRLFAKEIRLGLFSEGRFENAGATAADGRSIGKTDLARVARWVLMHGEQAGRAASLRVFVAHEMAGRFRRDHEDVDLFRRHDLLEVNRKAVRESQVFARQQIRRDFFTINLRCLLVRHEHHHHVAIESRFIGVLHHEPCGFGFSARRAIGAQAHNHFAA